MHRNILRFECSRNIHFNFYSNEFIANYIKIIHAETRQLKTQGIKLLMIFGNTFFTLPFCI